MATATIPSLNKFRRTESIENLKCEARIHAWKSVRNDAEITTELLRLSLIKDPRSSYLFSMDGEEKLYVRYMNRDGKLGGWAGEKSMIVGDCQIDYGAILMDGAAMYGAHIENGVILRKGNEIRYGRMRSDGIVLR